MHDRTRREEHRRRHEQPAAGPEEDVEAPAVEEEQEQEAGDDERSRAGDTPEVDVSRVGSAMTHPGPPRCANALRVRCQRHGRRDENEDGSGQDHQPGVTRHSIHGRSCKVGSLTNILPSHGRRDSRMLVGFNDLPGVGLSRELGRICRGWQLSHWTRKAQRYSRYGVRSSRHRASAGAP